MISIRETDADREVQERVKQHIEKFSIWELVATRTLEPYDFDAYVKRGGQKRTALIEVRRRNNSFDKYTDYWISYEKYKQLRLLGEAFCVPVIFVFVFDDGMYYIDLMELPPNQTTTYGDRGYQDTQRATDKEKVVKIYSKQLTRLGFLYETNM